MSTTIPGDADAPPVLSTQAQALITAFGARTDVNADQLSNFQAAVNASPSIINQINSAVASGQLTEIRPLPIDTKLGGRYVPDDKAIEVPLGIMTTPSGGRFNPAELTYVVGHEIQHAINSPMVASAGTAFDTELNRIAQTRQATHDYTAALGTLLTANRNNEATAHIAGFNAIVSMVRSTNATPSLEDIYRANPSRMEDFITLTPATPGTPATPEKPATPGTPAAYELRTGLTLNADMTMTPETRNESHTTNTEMMGWYYYDKPGSVSQLGHNNDSNYQNFYAANPISSIARAELLNAPYHAALGITPQLQLNMAALGINEAQLERNGLDFQGDGTRQAYFDISTNPPVRSHFDHTDGTHLHVPITLPRVETTEHAQMPQQAGHHAIGQAMDALDRSPNIPADAFGADRQRVAAGVALHAASQQIAPDHIVLNQQRTDLIAVQGGLSDPGARLSTPLPVAEAMRTDVQQASAKLDAPQSAQQQPAQQQSPVAQQDAPQQEAAKARAQ